MFSINDIDFGIIKVAIIIQINKPLFLCQTSAVISVASRQISVQRIICRTVKQCCAVVADIFPGIDHLKCHGKTRRKARVCISVASRIVGYCGVKVFHPLWCFYADNHHCPTGVFPVWYKLGRIAAYSCILSDFWCFGIGACDNAFGVCLAADGKQIVKNAISVLLHKRQRFGIVFHFFFCRYPSVSSVTDCLIFRQRIGDYLLLVYDIRRCTHHVLAHIRGCCKC